MDQILATLQPDEVGPALRLLTLFEAHGRIDPVEAEQWRWRIAAWARFNEVENEGPPNA